MCFDARRLLNPRLVVVRPDTAAGDNGCEELRGRAEKLVGE